MALLWCIRDARQHVTWPYLDEVSLPFALIRCERASVTSDLPSTAPESELQTVCDAILSDARAELLIFVSCLPYRGGSLSQIG